MFLENQSSSSSENISFDGSAFARLACTAARNCKHLARKIKRRRFTSFKELAGVIYAFSDLSLRIVDFANEQASSTA